MAHTDITISEPGTQEPGLLRRFRQGLDDLALQVRILFEPREDDPVRIQSDLAMLELQLDSGDITLERHHLEEARLLARLRCIWENRDLARRETPPGPDHPALPAPETSPDGPR